MVVSVSTPSSLRLAVLLSGNGSNLQAIFDAIAANRLVVTIVVVISDQQDAYGLQRAKNQGVPTRILEKKPTATRLAYDQALAALLHDYQPDLIVLAGFMRILSSEFVEQFAGKIINIHPSLLPAYPGLHTHERALTNRDRYHGLSIHFVTADLDAGPLIAQARCEVATDDTPESLKQRVQALEHRAYPEVLSWFTARRLSLQDGLIYLDQKPLSAPVLLQYPSV